jgi:hypothetical protein
MVVSPKKAMAHHRLKNVVAEPRILSPIGERFEN